MSHFPKQNILPSQKQRRLSCGTSGIICIWWSLIIPRSEKPHRSKFLFQLSHSSGYHNNFKVCQNRNWSMRTKISIKFGGNESHLRNVGQRSKINFPAFNFLSYVHPSMKRPDMEFPSQDSKNVLVRNELKLKFEATWLKFHESLSLS